MTSSTAKTEAAAEYAVASPDVLTLDFMRRSGHTCRIRLPEMVSNRIINEVRGINRVDYDAAGEAAGDD